MPHRGRRSCQAGLWFLSVWEHVLTPRDRDLNPVLGPVVIAPSFLLYHGWQTMPSATQHVAVCHAARRYQDHTLHPQITIAFACIVMRALKRKHRDGEAVRITPGSHRPVL